MYSYVLKNRVVSYGYYYTAQQFLSVPFGQFGTSLVANSAPLPFLYTPSDIFRKLTSPFYIDIPARVQI
jgi:hypothetical protein